MLDKCSDIFITSITAKPYILQKTLFYCICSKFIKFKHGLQEAKNGMKELLIKVAQQIASSDLRGHISNSRTGPKVLISSIEYLYI